MLTVLYFTYDATLSKILRPYIHANESALSCWLKVLIDVLVAVGNLV